MKTHKTPLNELPDAVRHFDGLPDSALISIPETAAVLGIGISTCWRRIGVGGFPVAVRLGKRCTKIEVGSLRAWLRLQKASAR